MKNIFILILCLNFTNGFSQNSALIILKENDTLESSDVEVFLKTEDEVLNFNESDKLLYDHLFLANTDIHSIMIISKKDTLNFNSNHQQQLTFEKEGEKYKKLSLSFAGTSGDSNFDFEMCKKKKSAIIIHFANKEFHRIYSKTIIGIENPEGKHDKITTSPYNLRKKKRDFKKKKTGIKEVF